MFYKFKYMKKLLYTIKSKLVLTFVLVAIIVSLAFGITFIIIEKDNFSHISSFQGDSNTHISKNTNLNSINRFFIPIIIVSLASIIVTVIMGIVISNKISKPIKQLISAGKEVLRGNINPEIDIVENNEIGELQKTYVELISTLKNWDIKQQEESEYKLLQSEKQACIGRLAAGVAHEINNPLTGVLTFTHLLLRRDDLPEDVKSDLKTIAKETERVRKIVKGLLDFSRQSELDRRETDINDLIKSTLKLVENQALVKGIKLEFSPCENLPIKTLDQNQIQSVLLNMIINAFDATKQGGKVTIKTELSYNPEKPEKKGISIIISDTGCGIPEENLNKIFDPFFTTKEVGQGTGLGLAVSAGIIEKHGGKIFVESAPGKGSTFKIWLPTEER
ncbi:MAG: hypothetical protein DRP84_05315 [Spirochaetes bacterium]|nr:MAG: hypothetical protein DRP84_05315 [Spirochaetota bacterium]